jgi:ERCC4-related helicase
MDVGSIIIDNNGTCHIITSTGRDFSGRKLSLMSISSHEQSTKYESKVSLFNAITKGSDGSLLRFLASCSRANEHGSKGLALSCSTQFEAFQYRPLMKFQGEAAGRILICDETGLGKTIESGYILTEEYASGRSKKILLMVKKRAIAKWKREMKFFFGMKFEEVTSVRKLVNKLNHSDSYLIITTHDIGRNSGQWWNKIQHGPDLMVVDEIHNHIGWNSSFRRPMMTELSQLTRGFVGLTATPIRNKESDLLRILELVAPGSVSNIEFQKECDILRIINEICLELLHQTGSNISSQLKALRKMVPDKRLMSLEKTRIFSEQLPESKTEVFEIVRILRDITIFSKHMTRARGRDPEINRFNQRIVHDTHWIDFDDRELRNFVEIQELLKSDFYHIHLQMLASCRPAFYDLISKGTEGILGFNGTNAKNDEQQISESAQQRCMEIGQEMVRLGNSVDRKFEELKSILTKVINDDTINDVVIFTHFWPTWRHLESKLSNWIRNLDSVKLFLAAQFDTDEALDRLNRDMKKDERTCILLATDRLNESIDLDAANCVINYDLPYSPQDLQQRIGRVDRIIQQADSIHVHNLAVRGSVDETIIERLVEKTKIFTGLIGGMEDVIQRDEEGLINASVKIEFGDLQSAVDRQKLTSNEMMFNLVDRIFDDSIREQRQKNDVLERHQHLLWKRAFEALGCSNCNWNEELSLFSTHISPEVITFLDRSVLLGQIKDEWKLAQSLDDAEMTGILKIYLSGENAMVSPLHLLSKWVVATCMQLEQLDGQPKLELLDSNEVPNTSIAIARIQGSSISKRVLISNQEEIQPKDWILNLQKSGDLIELQTSTNNTDALKSCASIQDFIELDTTEFERLRQANIRRLWAWKYNLLEKEHEEGIADKIVEINERISTAEKEKPPPPPQIDIVFEQSIVD